MKKQMLYLELEQIITEIQPEITVTENGEAFCSIKAVARLCGIKETTLEKHFCYEKSKLIQSLIEEGFTPSYFKKRVPDLAVEHIIKYYAYETTRRTKIAKIVLNTFFVSGIRSWLQGIKGWIPPGEKKQQQQQDQRYNQNKLALLLAKNDAMAAHKEAIKAEAKFDAVKTRKIEANRYYLEEIRAVLNDYFLSLENISDKDLTAFCALYNIHREIVDLLLQPQTPEQTEYFRSFAEHIYQTF